MSANRVVVPLCLSPDEKERTFDLSPISDTGVNRDKPSASELIRRHVIPIGELARELVPEGQLPWTAVEEVVRAAVLAHRERRAARRVRT